MKNKSIQQKIVELDELVAWFDGDEFELERAIDKFKQAEKMAAEIETDLLSLRNEINVIKKKFEKE